MTAPTKPSPKPGFALIAMLQIIQPDLTTCPSETPVRAAKEQTK